MQQQVEDLIDHLTITAQQTPTIEARHALLWAVGQIKFYLREETSTPPCPECTAVDNT